MADFDWVATPTAYEKNKPNVFYCNLPTAAFRSVTGKFKLGVKNLYVPSRSQTASLVHITLHGSVRTPVTFIGDSVTTPVICSVALASDKETAFNFEIIKFYTLETVPSNLLFKILDQNLEPLQIVSYPTIIFTVIPSA
jgi:hypothetical protein